MKTKKVAFGEERTTRTQWRQVQRRLKATQEPLEQSWTPTLAEKKAILKERAKALAQEPEK
jgi:hypothetical protein